MKLRLLLISAVVPADAIESISSVSNFGQFEKLESQSAKLLDTTVSTYVSAILRFD